MFRMCACQACMQGVTMVDHCSPCAWVHAAQMSRLQKFSQQMQKRVNPGSTVLHTEEFKVVCLLYMNLFLAQNSSWGSLW